MRLPVVDIPSRPAGFDTGPRSIAAVKVLRISVTDRCNYRCLYCMPEDGVKWLPKEGILTFEEIAEVVRAAIEVHGIRRFKLTGGEPTVRHGIVNLVGFLRWIDGNEYLTLTTNGQLLYELTVPLQRVGMDRVTVSLDSLHPDKFKRITRTGDLNAVMRGIDAAERAGFSSVKINCVTMRGTNDDEVVGFARMSIDRRVTVRFIEYMPLGDSAILGATGRVDASEIGPAAGCGAQDRGADALVPESEVRAKIEGVFGPLLPVSRESEAGVGPAKVFTLANAHGRIGFISAMSEPFCSTCNRLRSPPMAC